MNNGERGEAFILCIDILYCERAPLAVCPRAPVVDSIGILGCMRVCGRRWIGMHLSSVLNYSDMCMRYTRKKAGVLTNNTGCLTPRWFIWCGWFYFIVCVYILLSVDQLFGEF